MSLEGPEDNDNSDIDPALRQKAIDEIRESGKLPEGVTSETMLDRYVRAAKETLSRPINPSGFSISTEQMRRTIRKATLGKLIDIGISEDTGDLIIKDLEQRLGPGPRVIQ